MNRCTDIMRVHAKGDGSYGKVYHYMKPMVNNCKVTFVDGSSYWLKTTYNDRTFSFSSEPNTLYLDQECTVLADVTRTQKIQACKKAGLI
ncbi:hypothetical protein A3863_14430 [Priestia endophytica]|uniref:hypothetical protein n=1 Tax=Priestia endophytica TaxID=135735 RepID=UPI000DCA3F55|nr:hypothetical protein [Priestia endophytica]RAS88188.1 hypothetical protein A3863_14430 [Priestia endophytica]